MSLRPTSYRAVKRLPVHAGPAGWEAILPPRAPGVPLRGEAGCDVAIIGAGFAGLSAARHLRAADPTLDIVVLETGRVARSSAGRNSGFMIDLPHDLTSSDYAGSGEVQDRILTQLNRHAIDFAEAAVVDYGVPEGTLRRSGKINGAAALVGEEDNRTYAQHLQDLREPHEFLDASQMREVTGSAYYSSGLFTPGAALIQPAGYIRGLASGVTSDGVRIFEESPVTGFDSTNAGWILKTPSATLTAAKVILATNGHLESFGFKTGRLMHIMLNACMTAELPQAALAALGGQESWGLTLSDPMGCTVRRIATPEGGNRIVIRQGGYCRPEMQTSAADLDRVTASMRRKFNDRFPSLRGIPFEYVWSGHLCLSRNGVSVMQELEPGLYSACVQNGLGTTRGALTGIGAADLVLGRENEITRFFGAEAKPARLLPHPCDKIGTNVYLRWQEWRARAE